MKTMKKDRVAGIDEVRVYMQGVAELVGIWWTQRLLNTCMRAGKIPEECKTGLIVPIWKRKGDVQAPGTYIDALRCQAIC